MKIIKMDIITDAQTDTFHLKCTRQQQISLKSADIIITFSSVSLSFFFFYCFIYLFILTTDHSPGSKSNCRKELSVLLTTVQKKPQTEEQISPPRAGLQGTAHPELPSRSNTVFTPASRRDRALGQPRCANLSAVTETLERYECFLEAHQEEV